MQQTNSRQNTTHEPPSEEAITSDKSHSQNRGGGRAGMVSKQFGPPDLEYWDDLVGQRLNEAINNGAFDNLRNKGKRIKPRGNPHAGDQQLAYDLMEDNDLSPQWILQRKSVQSAIKKFRIELQVLHDLYEEEREKSADPERIRLIQEKWDSQVQTWQEKVVQLNDEIQTLNFIQPPVDSLEILKLRLDDELKRTIDS